MGVAGRRSSTPRANKQRKKSAKISPISRRKTSNIQHKRTVSPMLQLYAFVFPSAWRHPCSRLAIVENFALRQCVIKERNNQRGYPRGATELLIFNIKRTVSPISSISKPLPFLLLRDYSFFASRSRRCKREKGLDEFGRASPQCRFGVEISSVTHGRNFRIQIWPARLYV